MSAWRTSLYDEIQSGSGFELGDGFDCRCLAS